jgi:PAS domain S-box-containing protein
VAPDSELLAAMLGVVPCAIVVVDGAGRVRVWNDAAESLLGWTAAEVIGRDASTLGIATTNPDETVQGFAMIRTEGTWEGHYPLFRRDGEAVVCAVRARTVEPDDVMLVIEEVTTARMVSETASLLDALMTASPVGLAFFDSELRFVRVNEALARMTGRPIAEHLGKRPEEAVPELADTLVPNLWSVTRLGRPIVGQELPSSSGGSWLCNFYPWQPGTATTFGAGLAVVDVTARRRVEDERTRLLEAEQAAREELERVRDRLAFVVHAGSRLASTLDVGMTLETVADLVVPDFGRFCILDLWNGRRLDRVYVREDERFRTSLVQEMLDLSGLQREDHPAIQAVRTGRPVIVPSTDESVLERMYDDPQARRIVMEATGGSGFVTLPLITRGRVIGVLTLQGPGHSGRSHTVEEDVQMLEQVATRAAQSIENARLFAAERRLARNLQESERRQRQAALMLQRSLLPRRTHQPDELEIAIRYKPGTEGTDENEVGGDWYDVIPIAPGRTALVIGDVMGRGLLAASFMGQLRTAIRAYARQDLPPKQMLELVDGLVADLDEAEIVTCVYAVFDARHGSLTYASAGHLPLLLVDRPGRVRRLDHETGLPLGVGQCAAPEHVVPFPPDTLAVFYTDGLVEHRQRDIDAGIDELIESLSRAPGDLETMADTILRELTPSNGYDDDVAVLFARARESSSPASGEFSVTLPHDLAAAPIARAQVEETLQQWAISGDVFDNIVLTADELIANALRHGAAPVRVEVLHGGDSVVVNVHDGTSLPPQPIDPEADDEGGRGLQLVRFLSTDWGWRRTQRGKTVWCEHAIPVTVSPR